MILKEILDAAIAAMDAVGLSCTDDWRVIDLPGSFITVTNLNQFTLNGDGFAARMEMTLVAPDHGGDSDLIAMGELIEQAISGVRSLGGAIESIELNQQVTPPHGGKAPASTMTFTLFYDMENEE
ncbi:hypothetical protein [Corynebacterium diphtheriae]|uniref:Uncharacterized protein n=1 Tax=Corynebacterium diphtheriae bv. mitis TaxID=1806053 RepID=A0A854NJI7_CORDP|nr:hypothetical protein [Corynebacterium diphtheriae]ARB87925.1 hypothetical protein A6J36_05910 [Corynebacterium diphtheriae]EIK55668.1 hypothetical protein W5M_08704 [Corynebacterium diphtheriae bv. intermedius str. NCTC 5011]KKA80643.1 hypothetical protein VN94_09900 [Corynebacterium diphtheriae]MBG9336924.1 hypothetical protein [Corynebacterium diphtheriae bv. gravis]OSQ25312.1 hypothetical protein B9J72_09295 [Corynebacterium diphtheriae]